MPVPLGHSKEKYVRIFSEAVSPKIRAKLSSDLREFQTFKFMITLHIKLYREKPDGTVDYAEPSFHPRGQLVLLDSNEIENELNVTFAQIQEAIEKWTHNGSGWIMDPRRIYAHYHREISTLGGRLVYRATEIHQ